ncbi:ectoine dioxygenase [Streptomyces avidinii]
MTTSPRADLYPTRGSGETVARPRRAPTVWGEHPGPLSRQECENYAANGFHTFDSLLTAPEVVSYLAELQQLRDDGELRTSGYVVREPGSERLRTVFDIGRTSATLAALVASPRLTAAAQQVLGSEVYVHQSRINFKSGFGGAEFDWHSDFETWHAQDGMPRPRAVSISLALTENYAFNGPLMVMPGSHETFVPVNVTDFAEQSQRLHRITVGIPEQRHLEELADRHGIAQITGPPGSAVMFDSNLMHGSNGNITPFPRANIFIVYNSVENVLEDPFAASHPRPRHLANRDFPPTG